MPACGASSSSYRYMRTGEKHILGGSKEVTVRTKSGSARVCMAAISELWIGTTRQFVGEHTQPGR